MKFGAIKNCDIANGEGVRVTIFVSGCTHHCKDCFQPETWNFDYGEEYTEETADKIIEMLKPVYIDGLTLLGGEPMEPDNQRALLPLLRRIRTELPDKNVWCYSGFALENDLLETAEPHGGRVNADGSILSRPRCEVTDEMLSLIDVLVDGEFVAEQKNISLSFRGSENQRIIDLPASLKTGTTVVLHKDRHSRVK